MEERATYSTNTFDAFIKSIDKNLLSERDRGTLFELVTQTYLKNEPMYTQIYDQVWALSEVPEEYNIRKNDTGVDLVAREKLTGDLVAIQCKYYSEDRKIFKKDIDSFLNEVGRKYYSKGIIISSTDNWGLNAERALEDRDKSITRIGITQLRDSQIDWNKFKPDRITDTPLQTPKKPRSHQEPAIDAVVNGFSEEDRGKLIMAPGTGKTYTSLIIAEKMAEKKDGQFRVLYLVPSIQLLSQTLRGWTGDTQYRESMNAFAVCSDRKVTKQKSKDKLDDITATDLGFPATTNYKELVKQYKVSKKQENNKFSVVFSTYQSLEVIQEAQENGFFEFDLIICDEAHRTTGTTLQGNEESHFVKVHDNRNIKGAKRLYQTATPRVFGDNAKSKAEEMSVKIADMDDENLYGKEFYRLGFGEAVHKNILTDYKVMVLAVDESMVQKEVQKLLSDDNNELHFDDVTKIIGCWNGLLKRKNNSDQLFGEPMKRAIAFTDTIENSKMITEMFQTVVEDYVGQDNPNPFNVEIEHADGSMNAMEKNEKISWLKSEVPDRTCRILSNARFLTEGVDVPELDAVMFLKPRKSKIDIAQAVGRVMRKSPGKDYGYVILPIGVPGGASVENVLDNHDKYRVVWDVLNALRSIDERFDATINKLELNKKKPDHINAIGVGGAPKVKEETGAYEVNDKQVQMDMYDFTDEEYNELEKIIYGKIVKKVGNTRYWEYWSKDVAEIAQQHITRINAMLEKDTSTQAIFSEFLESLHKNINNSIAIQDAVEMVSQHMITKPVFDSLFEQESFALNNPISQTMDKVISKLESIGLKKEQDKLDGFYESVRIRAEGIDNLEAKQSIIVQLYDKFFSIGFKSTTQRLGIVFTPVEVVDFIITSVNELSLRYFGKSLSEENVNVLDPFTGTGTFITRLLQSGIIKKDDLLRKYLKEIHANEIILLSYYIAAINIEETFKEVAQNKEYLPYEGIVLTDTFASTEQETVLDNDLFGDNNSRLQKQKELPITVILGNPPYSIGQNSDNDDNQNVKYPKLDHRIEETYVKYSKANLLRSLYDSYIKAFRWSTDRIGKSGIIGFVTNASFIDSRGTDGLRKSWYDEFNYIYIFNLRGDQRTVGEQSRKEGGKIFGSGSRTPIAITLLVKDGSDNHEIFYNDIGDYLSQSNKLEILKKTESINDIEWNNLQPDSNNDWINQRNEEYNKYESMDGQIFRTKNVGVSTSRDAWTYNFNKDRVIKNSNRMIENYNNELRNFDKPGYAQNSSSSYIKWSAGLRNNFSKGKKINKSDKVFLSSYRPFTKKWVTNNRDIIERPGRYNYKNFKNVGIIITGKGASREFSAIVTDNIPNLHYMDTGQAFFLKETNKEDRFLDDNNIKEPFIKKLKIDDTGDAFAYIYAILNSKQYKETFATDLSKDAPRIPVVKYSDSYIIIGKKLMDLHLTYEDVAPPPDVVILRPDNPSYEVQKMKFSKIRNSKGKLENDKSTIVFNSDITIKNIPSVAYEYIVNGRSAIEWIMDQYQVKIDRKSGNLDDPNQYSEDPKYIYNLLLSIINLSLKSVELINSLPPFEIKEDD